MDKKKLLEVAKLMEQDASMYNQNQFLSESPVCDTQCCIAGYTVLRFQPHVFLEQQKIMLSPNFCQGNRDTAQFTIADTAAKILGLTDHQRGVLFGAVGDWPARFFDAYLNAESQVERARAGIARIKYFIKTGK